METSNNCTKLLHHYEGLKLKAYKCPAGVWTIGLGNTRYLDDKAVKEGDTITLAEAESLMHKTLKKFAQAVSKHMIVPGITQSMFDALVCFTYNVGIGAFEGSTLLRKLKAGKPKAEVAAQFHLWIKGGGKVLNGLVKRRAAEAWLFEHGEVKIF